MADPLSERTTQNQHGSPPEVARPRTWLTCSPNTSPRLTLANDFPQCPLTRSRGVRNQRQALETRRQTLENTQKKHTIPTCMLNLLRGGQAQTHQAPCQSGADIQYGNGVKQKHVRTLTGRPLLTEEPAAGRQNTHKGQCMGARGHPASQGGPRLCTNTKRLNGRYARGVRYLSDIVTDNSAAA